ncbi:nuclear transport factor 2 family protein [Parahaliea mediterranea]|uniref:Nuclear transport factor 2 family protein n=1 Tax=Parahaliea mediterranea TaxID=651086 RepID=A0A939DCB1_9GAMM|nr:nuclear transport factor 2 family protein [Parahaliea mediterranea]
MERGSERYEIEQLLYQYAWMVDEREWSLMDTIFEPGASLDYTSCGGQHGPYRSTLEWLARALSAWPINLHFVSNIRIDLESPDRASSRCYFMAPMGRHLEDGTQECITNAGYYLDTLVRLPEGWRIRERVCRQTVMIGNLPQEYKIPQ